MALRIVLKKCLHELLKGCKAATVWLRETPRWATERLRSGYTLATVRRQSAFGLLSRPRSILRLARVVDAAKGGVGVAFGGLPTRLRGHTPYALTKCLQTRMDAGKLGMTCPLAGMTSCAQVVDFAY
jgi:hypothetical protein